MLEQSAGMTFFMKSPKNKSNIRSIYVRVTVDGVPKETSTKRKWDVNRWDQNRERAVGTKEDARSLNFFLDSLVTKVNNYRTELLNSEQTITAQRIIDHVQGRTVSKAKVLEEFQAHNDEVGVLAAKGEYAPGTLQRYLTARSHVQEFIRFKYQRDDLEFRELNYEFIKDYEFYLRTVRNCNNNTTLKYIRNFKKIVLRAVAKDLIPKDPFMLFKRKWTKPNKKPLTKAELEILEGKSFTTDRLAVVRDVFVFQCYTGLAYIDVFNVRQSDIKQGIDGQLWIMISRQKTDSPTDIPLLPKALEILEKYKDHPDCATGKVLPVRSNQKMNAYLKEIADLCGLTCTLNTHKARRTFASTVTLGNGVPIYVVKELLGHYSVKQTEEYALTEQESISREMIQLKQKLKKEDVAEVKIDPLAMLKKLEEEINVLKQQPQTSPIERLEMIAMEIDNLRNVFAGGQDVLAS